MQGHAQGPLVQGEPGLPVMQGALPPGLHHSQTPPVPFHLLSRRERAELERQLYWGKSTYRAADALFPNYALNYPAPIHHHPQYQGSISPSIQYPEVMPPRYEEALLMPGPHPGPPPGPHLPLPTTDRGSAQGGSTVTTPLATSSPPIDRSQPPTIGSQHSLGLPFTTSTRTSLHDYENMRYPSGSRIVGSTDPATGSSSTGSASASSSGAAVAVRKRGRSSNRPPSDEFGRLHRDSTVIGKSLFFF